MDVTRIQPKKKKKKKKDVTRVLNPFEVVLFIKFTGFGSTKQFIKIGPIQLVAEC